MRAAPAALIALLPAALAAPAGLAAAPQTVDEIRACARANLPERSSVQEIELETHDRVGGGRTLRARAYWKRFGAGYRLLLRVDRPLDLRGAAFLAIEGDDEDAMYMYLPAVKRVRRITQKMVSDRLWGTDFSYEEVRRLPVLVAYGPGERLADAEVAGRPVYVLATEPPPRGGAAHERAVTSIDRATCVALETELHEPGGEVRKVLRADPASLTLEAGRWSARVLEMSDRREGTSTALRVLAVEHDPELPDRLFSPSRLSKAR